MTYAGPATIISCLDYCYYFSAVLPTCPLVPYPTPTKWSFKTQVSSHCSVLNPLHITQNKKLEVWQDPIRFYIIWPHSPILVLLPMSAVSPSLTRSGQTSLLALPFIQQTYSCLSAVTRAVSSAWNIFPWLSTGLNPSLCSILCSAVYQRSFPSSLSKRAHSPDTYHSPTSLPCFTFFSLTLITPDDLFMYLFIACLPPPECKLHERRNYFSIHC